MTKFRNVKCGLTARRAMADELPVAPASKSKKGSKGNVVAIEEEPAAENLHAAEDSDEGQSGETSASCCLVTGQGLSAATVRSHDNEFIITAYDEHGHRRREGGDNFFVSIRGSGKRVRAKVNDQEDGRYTVRYNPEISGHYQITVSLMGETLPGCPFECFASTPTPHAAKCVLRGDALLHAISRQQQCFEVVFR